MSDYKLFYFNARGRAETSRLIFAQAGVKYEDVRFTGEEWATKYKKESPFGTAPWLEVDGQKIGGSAVMARYLGEKFGLAGQNDVENAQLAAIVDSFSDCMQQAMKPVFIKDDDAKKAELMEQFRKDCPKWFDNCERRIKDNNGWLFKGRLTYVDLSMYMALVFLSDAYKGILDNYPEMAGLRKKVEEQPKIAQWIKDRPETNF